MLCFYFVVVVKKSNLLPFENNRKGTVNIYIKYVCWSKFNSSTWTFTCNKSAFPLQAFQYIFNQDCKKRITCEITRQILKCFRWKWDSSEKDEIISISLYVHRYVYPILNSMQKDYFPGHVSAFVYFCPFIFLKCAFYVHLLCAF